MLKYFHLMRYRTGRAFMMLFLGSMALGLGRTEGWVVGVMAMFAGVLMLGFACIHRRMRGTSGTHDEEATKFEETKKKGGGDDEDAPTGQQESMFETGRRMLKYFSMASSTVLFIAGCYQMTYTLTPGYSLVCT